MRILSYSALATTLLFAATSANTEKIIFTAPTKSKLPDTKPGIDFLNIESLSSLDQSLQTSLAVRFTNETQPTGTDHWYLLRNLQERQRYELRICWSATQPTRFDLDIYTIANVFDEPHLIQTLNRVLQRPKPRSAHSGKPEGDSRPPTVYDSVLFLHIRAAADYFSSNRTLMQFPPAVDVDIVLDPYIGGIFPQSLLSTAVYLVVLAILGWAASQVVWHSLKPVAIKLHND
ncbi:hypothetical protein AMS68_007684 [Peltaster fructicola]|uniref:Uncharacterized protein n=1 Tax=Peltaster fructicola TaxID=286661 RepID=A0A6H0Y544_9PEZI|nr:hypothetical protein AMS68_007684 [Peltaster fructicola]